jgi:hypothetical protein
MVVHWLQHLLQVQRSRFWFKIRSLNFFQIHIILPASLWLRGLLSFQYKSIPGTFLGCKERTACKTDNLSNICEPTVYKMCILNISRLYRPAWPVRYIALLSYVIVLYITENSFSSNGTILVLSPIIQNLAAMHIVPGDLKC